MEDSPAEEGTAWGKTAWGMWRSGGQKRGKQVALTKQEMFASNSIIVFDLG